MGAPGNRHPQERQHAVVWRHGLRAAGICKYSYIDLYLHVCKYPHTHTRHVCIYPHTHTRKQTHAVCLTDASTMEVQTPVLSYIYMLHILVHTYNIYMYIYIYMYLYVCTYIYIFSCILTIYVYIYNYYTCI